MVSTDEKKATGAEMNHEYDFIQIDLEMFPTLRISLEDAGFDWPPPEFIVFAGQDLIEATADHPRHQIFHRHRYSALTDEQISKCPNVARGAEYKYVEPRV